MNSEVLNKKGTLAKKAAAHNVLTNSVILGSLENENMTDVEIVTLDQYNRDNIYEEAMSSMQLNDASSFESIESYVNDILITSNELELNEFISIGVDKVTIGIDVPKIDDRAATKAMLMLTEVEEFKPGTFLSFT